MHTEISTSPGTGRRRFKVVAHLLVPANRGNERLHAELDGLAREMTLDLALGDRPVDWPVCQRPAAAARRGQAALRPR